jgi:VIT1/CCC1 family predicted Fe2+/Mn2+ transporter
MEAIDSWKEEKRSAYLYRALSGIEKNPIHKKLFLNLAEMADRQAAIWGKTIPSIDSRVFVYKPDLRVRVVVGLVHCFGARALRVALAAMKIRGMSIYQTPHLGESNESTIPDKESIEQKHTIIRSGNNIRAAVFGINDGLISNASLIFGIAGAGVVQPGMILLTGIAGLLAGACSMGAGEYVSVRSQREMLEYQLELERSELELYPEEEALELALIYQARGLPKEESEKMAHLIIQNPEKALDTLAREELGINPLDLMSPWGAAFSSFFSFSVGALMPLLPFIFSHSQKNWLISIAITGLSLFLVGSILSLFTQRSALWGGLRMLLIGSGAGLFTYLIGHMIGISV